MYRISELAQKVALSRSTLLYYEKLGIDRSLLLERLRALEQELVTAVDNDEYNLTLWAEGSAYIMGFANALDSWRRLLKPQGFLVVSDLIWLTAKPPARAASFWQKNYLTPLREKVAGLSADRFASKALVDLKDELDIHQRFLDDYGYQLFVLQKERADF
ncbi:hypothetical protein EXN22_11400 [Pseudomonas tructae]|uniref:HTH merR-type domain-containing protein n=1 Tax=Pseudomonas tructae TaxID=2518644 RepID=A0A411MHE9_9PSED|nr:hypothetical protein [Pseudomonas tructae]QBF26268.1 hypothetical protein EXN22_11400 [Pseudomonas tructae]